SHFVSWGPNLEGATGAAALQGYGDGTPVITGYAIMDPIAGLFGASAVMTAITHWRNTGKGQKIEVAQHEAGLQYVGEHILGAADGQPLEQTRGNHHAFAAPHGIFPCRGEDEWVVIACFDNKQWCGLSEAIGHPELATDSRFSSRLLRHRNQQLLAPVISCWSKEFDKHEIARILQDHGVPAAPVNKANDLNADPHLKQRGFFQPLTLPDVGTHQYPGLPFKFSKSTPHVSAPSPSFAEHNRQVLVDMLGLSEEEYAHLEREGVVADAPRAR
ncbi:MAG TPA: CoA transferase, partial [Trueperaceae bacterium]